MGIVRQVLNFLFTFFF